LKIFDEPKFLRRSLLEKLKIEKLLLLDIAARLQGYQGLVQKIHQLLLDTGTPLKCSVHTLSLREILCIIQTDTISKILRKFQKFLLNLV